MDLFDIPELRFDLPIAIEKFFCLKANTIVVMTKTPVILDTDIGDDIDDTWALVYLLKSQSLAPKLITTVAGNTKKKGKIVAKILKIAGRTKIPIGFGVQPKKSKKITSRQDKWVKDFTFNNYEGNFSENGVESIVNTVMSSTQELTIVAIGPLTNIAAALKMEPKIAERCKFIGMHGSIYRGYGGLKIKNAEYNVKKDVEAARSVFNAPWITITITPLDTCGIVRLRGDRFKKLENREKSDPLIKALIENYRIWKYHHGVRKYFKRFVKLDKSTILFDTVAIYLALSEELLEIETLHLTINERGKMEVQGKEGFESPDNQVAPEVRCALNWKDLEKFKDLLVESLSR